MKTKLHIFAGQQILCKTVKNWLKYGVKLQPHLPTLPVFCLFSRSPDENLNSPGFSAKTLADINCELTF